MSGCTVVLVCTPIQCYSVARPLVRTTYRASHFLHVRFIKAPHCGVVTDGFTSIQQIRKCVNLRGVLPMSRDIGHSSSASKLEIFILTVWSIPAEPFYAVGVTHLSLVWFRKVHYYHSAILF